MKLQEPSPIDTVEQMQVRLDNAIEQRRKVKHELKEETDPYKFSTLRQDVKMWSIQIEILRIAINQRLATGDEPEQKQIGFEL